MHFGQVLEKSIYAPWSDHYVDYAKLKKLLRETEKGSTECSAAADPSDEADRWTEDDEGAFVDELVNVQLSKVHDFQVKTYHQLRDRTSDCESQLEQVMLAPEPDANDRPALDADRQEKLHKVHGELESISRETNELEKFSRINFTGLYKATKKHDRKRGHTYRVRPLLQARLAAMPFNVEDYSPLLYR